MGYEIKLMFEEEVLKEIARMIQYEHLDSEFKYNKKSKLSIHDFIKGSVYREIERVKQYQEIKDKVFNPKLNFKNKFELLRQEKGFTQTQISNMTGITQTSLSKIFNNQTQLRLDSFFKLWVIFDCPPLEKCIDFVDGE